MLLSENLFLRGLVVALAMVAGLASCRVEADEKTGMPDLSQVDQTCFPTSTANLIIWFGRHGYPKLIPAAATPDERELRVVHRIMLDTDARFDWGTRMGAVTGGIEKYIRDSGCTGDVEYRGLGSAGPGFDQEWLAQNDDPNTGFILFLAYCRWNSGARIVSPIPGAGHAVTLVKAGDGMLLVHDPAHEDDETGRKILTPSPIADATWHDGGGSLPATGLLFLTGSLLESPPGSRVLLIGAVRITMHPPGGVKKSAATATISSARAGAAIGRDPASGTTPAGWWSRLMRALF